MNVVDRLAAIAKRDLDDRTISPGEAHAILDVVEASLAVRDGFPFLLTGTPGIDFGGKWVPFVEALAQIEECVVSGERMPVTPGNEQDTCPLCGIWRENAGYMLDTCGDDFQKPGCFVVSAAEEGDPQP